MINQLINSFFQSCFVSQYLTPSLGEHVSKSLTDDQISTLERIKQIFAAALNDPSHNKMKQIVDSIYDCKKAYFTFFMMYCAKIGGTLPRMLMYLFCTKGISKEDGRSRDVFRMSRIHHLIDDYDGDFQLRLSIEMACSLTDEEPVNLSSAEFYDFLIMSDLYQLSNQCLDEYILRKKDLCESKRCQNYPNMSKEQIIMTGNLAHKKLCHLYKMALGIE